jgi:hypothetical protein
MRPNNDLERCWCFRKTETRSSPGIKQSDLTKKLKGNDEALEALRYVLYFASELGQIVRIKKGNTYLLYLPGAAPT